MTDADLMRLVQDDQLSYMSQLFDRYAGRLYQYFRKKTSDSALSEDLTQVVFEKVIRSRHTYRFESPFAGWLFRIAHNSMIEYFRSKKNLPKMSLDGFDVADQDDTAEKELKREQKERLHEAINSLKEEHREVILLTRFQNLNYQEVAECIGLTENGVKARVHRAMKKLKQAYYLNLST